MISPGLGWNTEMSERDLDEAKLLHWSGKGLYEFISLSDLLSAR